VVLKYSIDISSCAAFAAEYRRRLTSFVSCSFSNN
jgi:hypothetical protein